MQPGSARGVVSPMRVRIAVVPALLVGCVGVGGSPAVAVTGPARGVTAGQGEACNRDVLASAIAHAPLRAHLGRIGTAWFELEGQSLDGGDRIADVAVAVLAQRSDRIRIAVRGEGVQLLVWIDRSDLSPITLAEHRVSAAPGRPPPEDGLGMTVYPGHPVGEDDGSGWVRVRGHGLFSFDGWIPDDAGELWEVGPAVEPPSGDIWIERGSSIVDDPDGRGQLLASVRRSVKAHLLESNALGADKVELVDADARLVGYAVRPPPMRRIGPSEHPMSLEDPGAVAYRGCLYSEPGGAVVGLVDAPLAALEPAGEGWGLTPIATPWGDVVFALRLVRPAIK
jgi:hypothetical protein